MRISLTQRSIAAYQQPCKGSARKQSAEIKRVVTNGKRVMTEIDEERYEAIAEAALERLLASEEAEA